MRPGGGTSPICVASSALKGGALDFERPEGQRLPAKCSGGRDLASGLKRQGLAIGMVLEGRGFEVVSVKCVPAADSVGPTPGTSWSFIKNFIAALLLWILPRSRAEVLVPT